MSFCHTYSSHCRPEGVCQFAQGAEILLEALKLWWRSLLDPSWAAGAGGRGPRGTRPLLLQTPYVGPHHQQQVAQEQLDDLQGSEPRC